MLLAACRIRASG